VARLFFGRKLDKSKVQPLLAAFNDSTERSKHLNQVNLLQRSMQIANKKGIIQIACAAIGVAAT
jgi:hypothetical protein